MPSSSASAVIDPQPALDEPALKDSDSSSSEDGSSDDEPAGETMHVSEAASRGNCICCLCGRSSTEAFSLLFVVLGRSRAFAAEQTPLEQT